MDTDSSSQLIDGRVSLDQCKKAVSALLEYARKNQQERDETELLPSKEQRVWLVVTVKRMQPMKKTKPHKILVAHPLVDPRTRSVCLITKDPQREYKDLLESHNIKFISRVVGVAKLKGKFKGFDARRLLMKEHGLFLTDDRVLPLLPHLLGKRWFDAKRQPIPVSLTKKDLKGELEQAISSTYMFENRGTCTTVKVANVSHTDTQVLANLEAAIPAVVAHIHDGWDNVQSLNIKTSNSVSLPLWTCPLGNEEPGSRWAGMVADNGGEWAGFGEGGKKEDVPVKEVSEVDNKKQAADAVDSSKDATPEAKGKKRVAESEGEVAVESAKKSSKKAKVTEIATPAPTAEPAKEPSSEPKKSQKPADGEKTPPTRSSSSKARRPSVSDAKAPAKATPSKVGTTAYTAYRTPLATQLAAEPSSKKSKQKRATAEKAPTASSTSSARDISHKMRLELFMKKKAMADTGLEKKKGKLRETEKSAHKGVKAQMVGKVNL